MKKNFNIFAIVAIFAIGLTACNLGSEEPQADQSLTASPTELEFPFEGEVKTVTVMSELGWTATPSSEWITVTPAGGEFTVEVGAALEARSGSITVSNGFNVSVVTVTQDAPDAPTVSTESLEFPAGGDVKTITVESDVEWTVSSQDTWIDVVKTNDTTVTVTVAASTAAQKTGSITITGAGEPISVSVTQKELNILSSNRVYAGENNGTHFFDLNFYCYEMEEGVGIIGDGGYHIRIEMHANGFNILNRRDYYFATGDYTFAEAGTLPAVIVGGDYATGSWVEWAPNPTPGENLDKISAGTFTFTDNGGGSYTVRLDATLEDGTPFVANYTGPMAAINPFIVSTLYDDVDIQIENGAGTLGFMGDWQWNGTYQWAVRVYDQGMTYVPPIGFGSGSYTGSGNLMLFEFIGPQEGDGQIIPAGTYTLKPVYQSGTMSGLNTAWTVLSGFDTGMGRVGTWFHEVVDGNFTESAPAMTGEVTVSYDGGKHIFEYDMVDDASNHITGRAEGTLTYSYEGE